MHIRVREHKHACKCTDNLVCFRTHTFDSCLLASAKLPENACVGIDLCMRFLLVHMHVVSPSHACIFSGANTRICAYKHACMCRHTCALADTPPVWTVYSNYFSCLPQGPKNQINCRIFTLASKGLMSGRIHCVVPRK